MHDLSGHLPYNSFTRHLKETFGCRVYKISVDAGFTCPTRDGSKGTGGCLYCDEEGSRAVYCDPEKSIPEQVSEGIAFVKRRYNAEKFIVYFQPYTNTYAPVDTLKKIYDQALCHEDIIGISIGTRPDCVDEAVLDLLAAYNADYYLWMEYGLQSACNKTLEWLDRGHDVESFVHAVGLTQKHSIRICAHVILGLPHESGEEMFRSAALLNDLGIDGVKIHSLYIARDAPIAHLYNRGEIELLTLDRYVDIVIAYLERLKPEILIHRVTGEARAAKMIAPGWARNKMHVINLIRKRMKERNTYQGKRYKEQLYEKRSSQ